MIKPPSGVGKTDGVYGKENTRNVMLTPIISTMNLAIAPRRAVAPFAADAFHSKPLAAPALTGDDLVPSGYARGPFRLAGDLLLRRYRLGAHSAFVDTAVTSPMHCLHFANINRRLFVPCLLHKISHLLTLMFG